jgi:hypothetical protein
MSYKEDLKIDKFRLDDMWENHPSLFADIYEKEIDAQFERDKAKEKLDLIRAELDQSIRSSCAGANEKITESSIANRIILDKNYQEANGKFLDSVRIAKQIAVGREAFEHRKKALEKLTDLFLSNYWSTPYIKEEAKREVDSTNSDMARKALQESMKNKGLKNVDA